MLIGGHKEHREEFEVAKHKTYEKRQFDPVWVHLSEYNVKMRKSKYVLIPPPIRCIHPF